MTKTMEGWRTSGLSFDNYFEVGSAVDESVYDYFLNVLPPAHWSSSIVQIGEPADHGPEGATFATLKRTAEGWVYAGNCYRRRTENIG